ncbi:kinesin-like protein KIF9 isoform X2 [Melanerpes formicivorus]|uniref:kinesin-like protein KIF9 isoform X2 n=1 Tax=Melanerpes formicivorus TaxID=211600 RepID=UPI00358E747F
MDAEEKRIRAFVRVKPAAAFAQDMIKFGPDNKTVDIYIKRDAKKGPVNNTQTDWSFCLDGVLHNASQELTYEAVARSLVAEALLGYHGTIMCYGQTGAGKTYTMTGATAEYQHRGIIPRALQQVFKATAPSPEGCLTVSISYLEIYKETLVDLLAGAGGRGRRAAPLALLDCPQGVRVKGLSIHPVSREEDALSLLFQGETNRVMAEHTLNKNSSRSHCIFTIYLESRFRQSSGVKCIHSKINLIDLAGSERLSKTGSEGQTLKEATYINKSLSFLEQIVRALADPRREHVPFRQSKLTHVLKDSLGGNCNTVLVTNICGEAAHVQETLASLRFAARMKQITAEPLINQIHDPEETVRALEKEITLLKQELAIQDCLANRFFVSYDPLSDSQRAEIKAQVHQYLAGATDEIDVLNLRQVQEVFKQFKLILRHQEDELEARFRSKYILVDRTDLAALAALQEAGLLDGDGCLVDEEHDQAFGTATASRQPGKKKPRRPKEPWKEGVRSSPGKGLDGISPTKGQVVTSTKDLEEKEGTKDQDAAETDAELPRAAAGDDLQRPSSPPARPVAFELFKQEAGSEISRIFKENKSILLARRKRSRAVVQRINSIRREMEGAQQTLEARQQLRCLEGEYADEEGQTIIDEEEYLLITKLGDLKKEYRSGYAELKDLEAEIQYCQHLVDQCRTRLISEFEIWYSESFLIPKDVQEALKPGGHIRPGMIPINRVMCLEEDEQDKFERLQETMLPAWPASASFYRAKRKADQKEIGAQHGTQPSGSASWTCPPQSHQK